MWFCFSTCYSVRVKNGFSEVDNLSGDIKLECDFCWFEAGVEPFKGEGSTFFKLGFGQSGWSPGHG
jgi:hypothetical protein